MNRAEFSDGFDVLLNSFGAGAGIECNEYEKSVFLTNSQEDTVINLYNGKNASYDSFESSEEMRRYLSNLVYSVELTPITNSNMLPIGKGSRFFSLPDGTGENPAVWFIVYEAAKLSNDPVNGCQAGTYLESQPIKHDEYHRIKNNPFRGATDRRALRLDLSDGVIETISKFDISGYFVRYLRRPKPILLIDLVEGLSINGETEASDEEHPCELHEALHQRILERAVLLAIQTKAAKTTTTNN